MRKIQKIESDVLFDQYVADQEWESKRIQLEKSSAAQRATNLSRITKEISSHPGDDQEESEDEVSKQAAQMGAALLGESESDDDVALADLFASLPVNEIDPSTGKTNTVLNGQNGVKVVIQDFGKWTGVNPQRILEETCRSRDNGVRLTFKSIADSTFAHRYSLRIDWSKTAAELQLDPPSQVEVKAMKKQQVFSMVSVATPESKQAEAYVATVALFLLFGTSTREDKVSLRLPPTWRDLWTSLASQRKEREDLEDRKAIQWCRDLVRAKRDQELEDGVLNQGAFRNRGAIRAPESTDPSQSRDAVSSMGPEAYRRIWQDKSTTQSFQTMLVSTVRDFLTYLIYFAAIKNATTNVGLQGRAFIRN
jgi:ATP-dependent RNA helicase DHX29